MGIMDFFKKKKKDDLGLGAKPPKDDMGLPPLDMGKDGLGLPPIGGDLGTNPMPGPEIAPEKPMQSFGHPVNPEPIHNDTGVNVHEKNFQILFSKLELIKSELDSIRNKVDKIEKIAEESQKQPKKEGIRW